MWISTSCLFSKVTKVVSPLGPLATSDMYVLFNWVYRAICDFFPGEQAFDQTGKQLVTSATDSPPLHRCAHLAWLVSTAAAISYGAAGRASGVPVTNTLKGWPTPALECSCNPLTYVFREHFVHSSLAYICVVSACMCVS